MNDYPFSSPNATATLVRAKQYIRRTQMDDVICLNKGEILPDGSVRMLVDDTDRGRLAVVTVPAAKMQELHLAANSLVVDWAAGIEIRETLRTPSKFYVILTDVETDRVHAIADTKEDAYDSMITWIEKMSRTLG